MALFGPPNVKKLLKSKKFGRLVELVDHEWVNVRKEAIEALGVLGDQRASEVLLKKLLNEHNRDVHDAIAGALAEINDPDTVPHIQGLLLLMKNRDEHKFNKEALIKVLDASPDQSAAIPLIFLLDDMEYVSDRAAKALIQMGPGMIPILNAYLFVEDEPFYKDSHTSGLTDKQPHKITYRMNSKIVNILRELGWSPREEKERLQAWYYMGLWGSLMAEGKEGEKLVRKRARTHPDVRHYLRKKEEKSSDPRKLTKGLKDRDFGYAQKAFDATEKLKTPEAKRILFDTSLIWLKKTADYRFGKKAAEYLITLATPEINQPLIEYLFRFPEQYGRGGIKVGQGVKHKNFHYDEDPNFLQNVARYQPVFVDYTPFILKLAGFKSYVASYQFHYPLEENISCIQELCEINSPISTNILCLVKGLKKIEVLDQVDQYARGSKKMLDFEPQKKIARKELKRRGNPAYDASAYLVEENWAV